jgi:PAS domain S-box-containing protein
MFGISVQAISRYAIATAVLIGAIWFDASVLTRGRPLFVAEQFLVHLVVALSAAGLALTWEAGRRGRTAVRAGLDRLVADLPVAVYQGLLTPEGRFQRHYLTPSIVRVTGWTVDQLPDHSAYLALVPDEDRSLAETHYDIALRDGEATSEYRLRRPDGTIGWIRHQTRRVDSPADGIELIGTLSDITASRTLTEHTAASEIRIRGFLDASPDAIVVSDEAGIIVTVSRRVEALLGYKPRDIIGKPHSILVPETRRAAHAQHVRTYYDRPLVRDMGPGEELRARRQDGSEFPAEISLSPYRSLEGLFVVTAIRDVTQRKQAQEQLRQAQKMEAVGQLTGGVAHDFNNLLTTILGNAELLEWGDKAFDAETVALIAGIGRAGQRAALLTQQLLAFSREQPLKPEKTELNAFIGGMSELLQRTLGERIVVKVNLVDGLWFTQMDTNQFENVVLNLAINARDAMPEGGRLTIETSNTLLDANYVAANAGVRPGPYVAITVTDTGTGMAEKTLERAFDPFFTTKPLGQGTGLGLSQVYGFVKQSGGHVKLYSESGNGTTVKIYLPRYLAIGESKATFALPPASAPMRGTETVLIVEDDASVRDFGTAALTRLGYHVLTADDASAALTCLDREPGIALLFTDIGLPGVNGRQLASEARQRYPALKVLFTTGYARHVFPQNGIEDATRLLPKPYTIDSLARQIRDVLDAA